MNYPDSVRYLYALGNEIKSAKLGLDRIQRLLEALGNPHQSCPFVHVAGTNGKGSVCAMVESALRVSGKRTGLYTSPHLLEPTERIRVNGVPVSTAEFASAFAQVHSVAERLVSAGEIEAHPTYFETVTAMCFLLFRQTGVEIGIVEVGLGGRLDATNVILPQITAITRIDYDHETWLGKQLEQIAAEKAGIIKPGVPVVVGAQRDEIYPLLRGRAGERNARVIEPLPAEHISADRWGSGFYIAGLELDCPLPGEHQVENARTAVAVLRELGVDDGAIRAGLRSVVWPGRMQRISDTPEIILDGAHNPSGASALADFIRHFYSGRRVTLIFAVMRDKAVEQIANILFPLASTVVVTAPHLERAVRPEVIAGLVHHPDVRISRDLDEAIQAAGEIDVAFITGSLFLVAEALGRWSGGKL
jgi:dihydrofolate synthase/folylpolyglutamate synthase